MQDATSTASTAAHRDVMEELIAECLRAFEETGPVGLRAILESNPDQRAELESCLAELQQLGLVTVSGPDPSAATTTLGEFELQAQIGGGGMGIVHRAWQPSLRRHVALKIVRQDRLHLDSARARFQREAEAVAGLRHPGIVPVFSVGEDHGVPWLAMELVDGRTLAEVRTTLSSRRPSTLHGTDLATVVGADPAAALFHGSWTDTCVRVASQIADALAAAHASGVLHRDIKPSNVFVDRNARALLFDFGLAQPLDPRARLPHGDEDVGSPAYMAPELLRREAADVRTDVYGVGITLYEMLALERPFLTTDPTALREQIVHGERVPLRLRNPSVSRDVETIVACAMDPDGRRRYADATALRADLERFLGREPIRARRPGPWVRVLRFCQRRPAIAVGVAGAALLAVGIPTAIGVSEAAARRVVEAERQLAERHLDTALAALNRFVSDFGGDELAYLPGLDAVGRDLLDDAIALHESLATERPDDARVALALAEARRRQAWLHKRAGALAAAGRSIAAAAAALPPPSDAASRLARSDVLRTRSAVARAVGDLPGATAFAREAIAACAADGSADERATRASARVDLARALTESGDSAAAIAELIAADAALAAASDCTRIQVALRRADGRRCVATAQFRLGHVRAGLDALRDALAILDAGPFTSHDESSAQLMTAEVLGRIGRALAGTGERREASTAYDRAIGLLRALVDRFPDVVAFRTDLIDTSLGAAMLADDPGAGDLLDAAERQVDALPVEPLDARVFRVRIALARLDLALRSQVAIAERSAALEAAVEEIDSRADLDRLLPRQTHDVARAMHSIAVADARLGRAARFELIERAIALKEAAAEALDEDVVIQESVVNSRSLLAALRAGAGLDREALAEFDQVIAARRGWLAQRPDDHKLRHRLSGTLCNAASSALAVGDPALAVAYATEAEQLSAAAVAAIPHRSWKLRLFDVRCVLARALAETGRLDPLRALADALATSASEVPTDRVVIAAARLAEASLSAARAGAPAAAEEFARRSVAALDLAAARGFERWDELTTWPSFVSLEHRADYRALLDRLGR